MKTFKKTLALFLATLMIVSAFAAYSVFATTNENEPAAASEPVAQAETVTPSTDFEEETRGGVTAYYVDSLADFLAYNNALKADDTAGTYTDWYGKTIILTTDIDMAGYTWSQAATFRGILDGQGHTIKNLDLKTATGMFGNTGNSTIKNISFINVTSTATHPGVFARDALAAAVTNFENVYIDATITPGTTSIYAGGFLGQVANGTLNFNKCVSNVTITAGIASNGGGVGGFVGWSSNGAKVTMTDCVFTGDISNTSAPQGVGAFMGGIRGLLTLNRCVSLGKVDRDSNYAGTLVTLANPTLALDGTIGINDCYVAQDSGVAIDALTANEFHSVSIAYGNDAPYTLASGTKLSDKVDEMDSKIVKIGTSTGATLNASNFHRLCTVLLANGWVMTNQTVTYGTGLTVPEIMPATVATMLKRTTVETGNLVNAEKWHIKDNGDTLDIRFIGSIKEDAEHLANYDNVGMMIVVKEGDTELVNKQYNAKAVYTSMYTDVDGVEPIIAGEDTYLYTVDMRGFNKDSSYTVTFVAFATYNGVNILDYDGATTITITSGEIA